MDITSSSELGEENNITAMGTKIIQKLGVFQFYLTFGKTLHGEVNKSMCEIRNV